MVVVGTRDGYELWFWWLVASGTLYNIWRDVVYVRTYIHTYIHTPPSRNPHPAALVYTSSTFLEFILLNMARPFIVAARLASDR